MGKSYSSEMEIRQEFALTALRYCGIKEGSQEHKSILSLYNSINPLPRGYILKESDAWCAGFVSAIAKETNLCDLMPVECSCSQIINNAKERGIWVEADDYFPTVGDWILYDWNGKPGENTSSPDHVGIVFYVSESSIWVVEGNYSNSVKVRCIGHNHDFIRGYVTPQYYLCVKAVSEETFNYTNKNKTVYTNIDEVPAYGQPTISKLLNKGVLRGLGNNAGLGLSEDMVRIFVILDRVGTWG